MMSRPAIAVFTFLCLSAAAVTARAGDTAEIEASMEALAKAFETHDVDRIRSLMTPDHIAINSGDDHPVPIDEQMAELSKLRYSVIEFGEPTVSMIDTATALVIVEMIIEASLDGVPQPGKLIVSQIWVNRDGEWLQRLYQETAVGD